LRTTVAVTLGGGVIRLGLLGKTERHAQDHHGQHHRCGPYVAGRQRDGRQHQEQDHQGIDASVPQEPESPVPLFLGYRVGTVLFEAARGLFLGQAVLAGLQQGEDRRRVGLGDLPKQCRGLDSARRPAQRG
jgi:hypothetical protein